MADGKYTLEEFIAQLSDEELADQGVLYDHNGNLGIRMQVVDSQRGIELILMVLMNFYDAVKSIGHN